MKQPKLSEIAARINVYLKRFEANKKINPPTKYGRSYYRAFAVASGRFVYVTYISYQNNSHLNRADAERYLAWLDAGNVGRHYECFEPRKR